MHDCGDAFARRRLLPQTPVAQPVPSGVFGAAVPVYSRLPVAASRARCRADTISVPIRAIAGHTRRTGAEGQAASAARADGA